MNVKYLLFPVLCVAVFVQACWVIKAGYLISWQHNFFALYTGMPIKKRPEDVSVFFTKFPNARGLCGAFQIGHDIFTENAKVAMELCMDEPKCVFVTRWGEEVEKGGRLVEKTFPGDSYIKSGFTVLCSGYQGYDPSPVNKGWVAMEQRGCDKSGAKQGVGKMLPGFSKSSCKDHPVQCGECDAGMHLVMSCGPHGQHVCHECEHGSCPVPKLTVRPDFAHLMQDEADKVSRRLGRPFFAYNPTLTVHRGETYVLARITDQAKCVPAWDASRAQPFESFVLLCSLTSASGGTWPRVTACRIVVLDLVKLLRDSIYKASTTSRDKDLFVSETVGLEDARAFSVDDRFYLIGAAVLKRTIPEAIVTRQVVVGLDDGLERGVSATVLYPAMEGICADKDQTSQKNWVFLHHRGQHFVFAYMLHPLIVVRCNVQTGCCRRDASASTNLNASDIAGYRGSTPAVRSLDGRSYKMILHKQTIFTPILIPSLPTVYHNKVVSISAEPPYAFLGASEPFRLPTLTRSQGGDLMSAGMQDLQFVTGLHLAADGSALVTYGVGDCASAMVRADSLDVFESTAAASTRPSSVSDGARFRLEGPFRSMQSVAKVNRLMADGLAAKGWNVEVVDTGTQQDFNDWSRHLNSTGRSESGLWASSILLGSLKNAWSASHANITIRNLWPVHFHQPVHGDLVLNFAWEFYHIPDSWVQAMSERVREIWVPTSFVKEGLVTSGVAEEKIVVMPQGVNKTEACPPPTNDPHEVAARAVLREDVEKACGKDSKVFLYNGGLLHRKAFDSIVEAYFKAFTRRDKVCLVIHSIHWDDEPTPFDFLQGQYEKAQGIRSWKLARPTGLYRSSATADEDGGNSKRIMAKLSCTRDDSCTGFCEKDGGVIDFFHDEANAAWVDKAERRSNGPAARSWAQWLPKGVLKLVGWETKEVCFEKERATATVEAPRMLVTTRFPSNVERAELFRLSGALVHTSRSEDFGAGAAEAMACGVPVVTTDQGAVNDFADEASVWKVKSRKKLCSEAPCGIGTLGKFRAFGELMSKPPLWLEYDAADLARVLRQVFVKPTQAAEKARRAKALVEDRLLWPRVQQLMRERAASLYR